MLENASGRLVGIEVKCAATIDKKDFMGLETLAQITGDRFVRGVVLYTGESVVPFGEALRALPIEQLWT